MLIRALVGTLMLVAAIGAQNQYENNGTHWIVLPDKIIEGQPLPVTFNFYNTTEDIVVQVDLLQYDHESIASLQHTFPNGEPGLLQVPVPKVLHHAGTCKLLMTGLKGVYFQDSASLTFDKGYIPKRFAVHIQLDKAIYKPGQTIHFRTFGVYSDMSVFNGRFDVTIKDPKNNIMKQLKNVTSGAYGVLEDFMVMDEEPVLGQWQITSMAYAHDYDNNWYTQKSKTKTFSIDKYVLPKFSVSVNLPTYVVTTDKEMTGTVIAKYTYGKPVLGTVIVKADINYAGSPWKKTGDEVMVETTLDINGDAKFTIPFDRITHEVDPNTYQPLVEKLAGYNLVVSASVTESLNNITRISTSQVKFYKEPYQVTFSKSSSPSFFKPGLPYVGHISITQADGRPVISSVKDVVLKSYVKFYDRNFNKYRALTLSDKTYSPPANGLLEFMVDPPDNAYSLHLQVEYKGLKDTYDMNKPYWMIENGNLQLSQENSSLIGSTVDFKLLAALPMENVFYSVITNSHVIHTGMLYSNGSKSEHITFDVTDKMKPYSKLLVYYFTTDGWNADSIYFTADTSADVFKNKVSISFDRSSAEPAENVSLQIATDPLSLVNVLAVDQSVLLMATGNDITQGDVISSLRPNDHPSQDSQDLHDPKTIMQTPGVQTLTDVTGFYWAHHSYRRQVDCGGGGAVYPTYAPGMYPTWVPGMMPTPAPGYTYSPAHFPGTALPGSAAVSEIQCISIGGTLEVPRSTCVRFTRQDSNKFLLVVTFFYLLPKQGGTHSEQLTGCADALPNCADYGRDVCTSYQEWARQNCISYCNYCVAPTGTNSGGALQEVTHVREEFPETWLWTDVTSGQDGSAVISATVPDTITSWFATAFSVNTNTGLGVTNGAAKFTTFRPFFINMNLPYSVIRGEQVVLQINVFNYMGQDLDVVVTLDKSDDFDIILNKSGHVSYVSQEVVKNVNIKAGVAESVSIPIRAHIVGSAEISVKAQSALSADGVIRQLKVEAEGNPMHFNVPVLISENNPTNVVLSFPDNFVTDSQKVQISAIGDIMGPTTKNLKSLLRMPNGCGEQSMTNLAPDVFVYNYLKSTGQLTNEVSDMAKHYMTTGYQRELAFQRRDGSFSIWGQRDNQGSMWLTAFVLKSFHQAKEHIFVSDNVLIRAADWIGMYQNYDGSFRTKGMVHSTSLRGGSSSTYSLTAFVLISLMESEPTIKHYSSSYFNKAVRARSYLETHLHNMTDVYDLSITAYALAKAGSVRAFMAYTKLDQQATTSKAGEKYWKIPTPSYTLYSWENYYARESPLSVEASAYALLYLTQTKQLSEGLPVMKWLVSQRNSLGGFTSTQDTVLGLQALSEFGYAASADLDLNIDVDASSFHNTIHVTKSDALVLKLLDLPLSSIHANNVHGASAANHSAGPPPSVSLEARGKGSALVQVAVSFNVEVEPSVPAFNLTAEVVDESLHSIVVKACAKYEASYFHGPGMAVIEIDLPTGFDADLESPFSDLLYVKKSEIRNQKTVVLYYDEITPYVETCAFVELVRSDLVANIKPAAVRVYDYYQPERYRALTFYQSSILKDSSFCDICSDCGC